MLTWLYNGTGGSILACAIWHGLYNLETGTAAVTTTVQAITTASSRSLPARRASRCARADAANRRSSPPPRHHITARPRQRVPRLSRAELAVWRRASRLAQPAPRARACGGATHRQPCQDGEDLPAEPGTRLINSLFRALTRLGLGASYRHILTVPGRKTGQLYSTPVDIIERDDQRWLVAGYGPTNWVRNVCAAGEVTLSRGRQSERFRVEQADRPAAVPVLRTYMREIRVTRPYFDASPNSADEDVAAELPRHPVFRLIPGVNGGRQTDAAR